MRLTALLLTGAAALAAAPSLDAQDAPLTARADLIDQAGRRVGEAMLVETPNSGVLIRLELNGVAPGTHGFHIHAVGRCDPPTFESAGGHYAPRGRAHGFYVAEGPHAGDLANIHVPENGRLIVEQLAPHVTLRPNAEGTLFDEDGSAIMVHADPDDYRSQPAGDAGSRIACGVVVRN